MKEHPILFSTAMVQAILDGRKTQTRRIIKPQPELYEGEGERLLRYRTKKLYLQCSLGDAADPFCGLPCKYKVGDKLWVRETAQFVDLDEDSGWVYKASENGKAWERNDEGWTWRPSLHMPKSACRIWLEITDIRVERVQDIGGYDATQEGIQPLLQSRAQLFENGELFRNYQKPAELFNEGVGSVESFKTLWQSINGPESWEANPFVWAISFKRIDKP